MRFIQDTRSFYRDMRKDYRYALRLAKADLETEVINSYLDWLWWLLEPLGMMLVYIFIYGVVFNVIEEYFSVFIFIGLTMWSFFAGNIMESIFTVRKNSGIISRIYIPKYILLFSRMLVNGFKMLISFGIVALMMLIYRIPVSVHILYIIPILFDLFLITFACGTILLHYGVFVRDLSYVTNIALRMMMYLSGIFYAVGKRIPPPYGEIMEKANPIAWLLAAARDALIYKTAVSWELLVLWAVIGSLILLFGISLIYRNENSYMRSI